MTVDELIAALETASEGSRDLDLDIARAIYPKWQFRIDPADPALLMPARVMVTTESGADEHVNLALYTTSIDMALTLLPEWASYELTRSAVSAFTRCRLWDWRRAPTASDNEWKAEGNRPLPLNICIAGLRARSMK
jgi:hypothetical protein